MGYCKQCGAYIPDGQTSCLACGFDEAAKPNTNAASAAAQAQRSAEDTERLRRQMEEQRARQQEQSRLWAEQEAARRKAREEARQAREEEEQTQNKTRRNTHIPYSPDGDRTASNDSMGSKASSAGSASSSNSKTMAILSYLSVLCFIPFFACKNDDFAMFHAKQGLTLFIFSAIGNIVGSFVGFGWLFTVAQIYFIFKGISNANAGIKEPLPYIGNILKL